MTLACGIDVGGTKIAGGVVDESGSVPRGVAGRVSRHRRAGDRGCDREAGHRSEGTRHPIEAVGVGAAGYIDKTRSVVLFAPNLAWRDLDLKADLESTLGLPVVVENDANAADGEFQFGAGHDVDDLLRVTVGTGDAGQVEQIGTQTDIYLQPQTRFVAEFIGANNGLEGTVASVDGSGEDARATVRVGDLTLARPRSRGAVGRRRGDRVPSAGGRPRPRGRRGHRRPMAERRRGRGRSGDLRRADGPASSQPRRTRDPGRRERQPAAHGRPGRGPDRPRVRRPHADPRGVSGANGMTR